MHAAGRDVDRSRIEEEPGDGAAIDMHPLEFLAVDLDVEDTAWKAGDRRRGAQDLADLHAATSAARYVIWPFLPPIGLPRMTKAWIADLDAGQGRDAPTPR